MNIIFMNSKFSKISDPHGHLIYLDKIEVN